MGDGSTRARVTVLAACLAATGCGGKQVSTSPVAVDASVDVVAEAGAEASADVDACDGATSATLSGKVFDPANIDPLFNVLVYVPMTDDLPAIAPGSPTCAPTNIAGGYITLAVTDVAGSFSLHNVPTGDSVPVVVQAGKFRMEYHLQIPPCGRALPDHTLHLPGRRTDGDMPQMAVLTGGADNVACFLSDVGIDPGEFGPPGSGGRVDVYRGVGGADLDEGGASDCSGTSCPLWSSLTSLEAYDLVLLGCEGTSNLAAKPAAAVQAMHDWMAGGGEMLGVHSQDVWLSDGPPDLRGVATWVDGPASGAPGPFAADPDDAHALALMAWAKNLGATDGGLSLAIDPVDVATSVASVASPGTAWLHDESTQGLLDGAAPGGSVKALSTSVNAPVEAGEQAAACGRVTLTDIHPNGITPSTTVPLGCATYPRSPDFRVLEYLLFDLMTPPPPGCEGCPPPPPPPPPDGG
jgi:hypothetical protein